MVQKEIIEDNKLIAEFMGWSSHPKLENCSINRNKNRILPFWVSYNMEIPNDEFKYHSSWDWLMPVVEKIESLNFKTVLATSELTCYKYYMNIITGIGIVKETIDNPSKLMCKSNSKIECVWSTVVEFIKWYNKQPK